MEGHGNEGSFLTHQSSPLAWLHALFSCLICLPACGLFDLSIQGIGKAMVRIGAAQSIWWLGDRDAVGKAKGMHAETQTFQFSAFGGWFWKKEGAAR